MEGAHKGALSRHDFIRLTVAFTGVALVGGLGCSDDLDTSTRRPGAGSSDGEDPGGSSGGGSSSSSSSSGSSSGGDGGGSSSGGADGGSSSGGTDAGPVDSGGPVDAGVDAAPTNACANQVVLGTNQITNFHNHALTIPAADFVSAADKTYNIQGASGHAHNITITAAQFTMLRAGGTVVITSTNVNNHTHNCTVKCG